MPSQSEIVTLLQGNEAFAATPEPALIELANGLSELVIPASTVLIQKGVRCGSVFIITDGEFGVFTDPESAEPVAELGRGQLFGEIGAVSGIEATASVKALTDGNLLKIPGPLLHQVMKNAPELASSLLRSLARYLGRD